jgi:Uma2 family endonuclease
MSLAILDRPPKTKHRRPVSTRLLTSAELAEFPNEINGSTVRLELYDGELVIMAPPAGDHGDRQKSIFVSLLHGPEAQGLGVVFQNVGIKLGDGPDTVLEPDTFFVLQKSFPRRFSPEGYLLTIPEIVVEVRSKNDRRGMIELKNEKYLAAGVQVIWRLEPKKKIVVVTTPASETTLTTADTLTCDLLPGFAVPVAELFA